ncbi:MAG: sulfatase [Chloroflexi bacterium]|nr:sulfatase [Chloroflexota bacterium]
MKRRDPSFLGMTRACVAVLVLLLASFAQSMTLGASSRISPLASPMASPVPVARALDLAAMALTPSDLDDLGLTGFGQQTSAFLTLEEQVEQLATAASLGMDADAIGSGLAAAGFQRRYQRQLGLPSRPGAPPSRLHTFVAPYVIEYASSEGAAAGFALLETEAPDARMKDVPETRVIGDRSEVTRFRQSSENGEPYRALDLTFQVDNLVAGVTVGEFHGREPDLATVEALAERLLERVRLGQASADPGLSNLALRLGGPDIETRSDEYGRISGQTFPNYSETPDEFADRTQRYGDAVAVYGVGQSIPVGGPARTDDTRYFVSLYEFGSERDAVGWLQDGVARAELSPNVIAATPVAGAAVIGDASATLAIATERGGAGTARGYLVEVRVGARTAQVQLLGVPDVPLAPVEELARSQVACLQAGACPGYASPPASLPQPAATPEATPGPGGPSGTPKSCSLDIAAAGTPLAGTPQPPLPANETGNEPTTAPNIIVIVTDDLDARSVACLPNVQALLAAEGVTFTNAFATTPLCCPSRASILRGQYAHNHGVLSNSGDNGGFPTFYRLGDEESTVATWLQDTGYRTALVGKYLNRYPKGAPASHVPPGWDEWSAFASSDEDEGGSYYSGYALNVDGDTVFYGQQPAEYSTDVLTAEATDFVDRAATSGDPFFLYIAPFAPHGPSTPASRHTGAFADVQAPRPPSFDEDDVSDKPTWVQALPPLRADQIALLDDRYQRRLRSLLAVDEMVASLIETLTAAGTLDNTYILFTSDNGYHLGEHGIPVGKQSPYDESLRVPLIVRGPGVPTGVVEEAIALNIDLAPTFAELAGASPAPFVDGRSLVPLLHGETPAGWRQGFLVEHYGRTLPDQWGTSGPVPMEEASRDGDEDDLEEADGDEVIGVTPIDSPPYLGLRTEQYLYVEYANGERELYDMPADPYQLQNLAATADPALLADLAARLDQLRVCAGADCRSAEDTLPGVPLVD